MGRDHRGGGPIAGEVFERQPRLLGFGLVRPFDALTRKLLVFFGGKHHVPPFEKSPI
jgi:hypothetical protein